MSARGCNDNRDLGQASANSEYGQAGKAKVHRPTVSGLNKIKRKLAFVFFRLFFVV